MKINKIILLVWLVCIITSKAQTWNYLKYPQNNKIASLTVYDSVVAVHTFNATNTRYFDLNGKQLTNINLPLVKTKPKLMNTINHDTLYYQKNNVYNKVKAPFYAGNIAFDSKKNIYAIYYDTLWKYDGNLWSSTRIQPLITDSSITHNLPCNYSGEYSFVIDKSDILWGTSSCYMGYATDNFWIDLKTMEQKYRAQFGDNLFINNGTQTPFVDKFNNKLTIPNGDSIYVLDEVNLDSVKQKIAIPSNLVYGLVKIGGYTSDSILYYYSEYPVSQVFYQNGTTWIAYSKIKSDYLLQKDNRDAQNNAWTYSYDYQFYKNDGVKIDTFYITNPNDTLNACYQDSIKNHLLSSTQYPSYHKPSVYKNFNGQIWVYQIKEVDFESYLPALFINPKTCVNDLSEYYRMNSIKDATGAIWKIKLPSYYSDSMNIKKYVSGQFKTVYTNNSIKNPLSKLYFVDNFGNFWATYSDNWKSECFRSGSCNYWYTQRKLIRFDGSTWTDYGSLDTNVIGGFKGKNNDVWFVTTSKLMKYNGATWINYDFPTGGYCTIDKKGTIWLSANSSEMLFEFDGSSWILHHTNTPHTNFTPDMVNGGFWIKTKKGAAYSKNGENWTEFNLQNGLTNTDFDEILVDAEGDVWFASETMVSILSHESVVGVDDETMADTKNNIEIYPNPVTNVLHLKNSDSENILSIYSMDGHLIQSISNVNTINVENLHSGLYTLKIQNKNGVQFRQFVKN